VRQIKESIDGFTFLGSLENTEDLLAASIVAGKCPAYAIDEDDEDYCEGARTCFNCRYRRWLTDGFGCVKKLLRPL
jgi:hypothetical protein